MSSSSSLASIVSAHRSALAVLAAAAEKSDLHFHEALEEHGKLVAGVLERPVYGYSEHWRGESEYYARGIKEEEEARRRERLVFGGWGWC